MNLERYVKDCFKRVNAELKTHKCALHAMQEPIGYEPYIESVKSIYPVGKRTEAEFKVVFPAIGTGDPDDVVATVAMRFDDGQVQEGSRVTALAGGTFVHKCGTLKTSSLGWYVEWDD